MRTLLAPIDFSETSKNAFKYTLRLARRLKAGVKAVHIFYEDYMVDVGAPLYVGAVAPPQAPLVKEDLKKFTEKFISAYRYERVKDMPKIETEVYDSMGYPSDKIIVLSKSPSFDIVVMGRVGESGIWNNLFGSVSIKVAQGAFCPVLLVPEGVRYRPIKKMLFAQNFDESIHPATYDRLLFIASCFGAEIHSLFVDPRKATHEMDGLVNREWNMFESTRRHFKTSVVEGNSVLEVIHTYAQTQNIDLIAVSTHHRNMLDKLFHESVTREVAEKTKFPILVLHTEDKFSLF